MSIQIETILFDLDGTLIDTELTAALTIRNCFKNWGISVDEKDAEHITGRTWSNAFIFLFGKYKIPVSEQEGANIIMQTYRDALENQLQLVPGGANSVRSLAEKYTLGLVSGSGRKEILWALAKLGILEKFKIILGAEDYPHSKPAPDGYLKAMNFLKADPKKTLVFEDSKAGIQSARSAGTWVVAITSTNHFQQDTSLAHHHISDLTQVSAQWITQFPHILSRESKEAVPS